MTSHYPDGGDDRYPILYDDYNDTPSFAPPHHNGQPASTHAINSPDQETTQLKVYKRRWYIMIVFSALCFAQGGLWNTWSPIADSSKKVFGWTDGTLALMTNWGPITYITGIFLFTWLMDSQGLRTSSIVVALLVAVGTGLRCITSSPTPATWLIHVGQILNGFGGPVAMGGAPLLSATWFPPEQRTTATGIVSASNNFGLAVSFFIGPLLVSDFNATTSGNTSSSLVSSESNKTREEVTKEIMYLMYYEFGFSVLLLLLILVYFPAKPPTPPSITAGIERLDYKTGVIALFRHKTFWLLSMPYIISNGVWNGFTGVLGVLLTDHDISQDMAGWVGAVTTTIGVVVTIVITRVADRMKRRMKLYLIVLSAIAFAAMLVFSLAYVNVLPFSTGLIYATMIITGCSLSIGVPLYFELTCESTYPIAEGVTCGILTWANNVTSLIILLIMMIPNIGNSWMSWCQAGSIAICIPILLTVHERFSRLDVDSGTPKDEQTPAA